MRNGKPGTLAFLGALVFAVPTVHAYEIATHALIADHAYRNSVLNPSKANSIVPALGFDRLDTDYPFALSSPTGGVAYRDEVAVSNPASTLPPIGVHFRTPQRQERDVLEALTSRGLVPGTSGQAVEQRVRSWLVRGAVREDDNDAILPVIGWYSSDKRDPDPFGRLLRATRHFYDPVKDRAFNYPNYCATYTCVRSILWALGRTSPLDSGSDADDTSRRNHFTWQDARNNYWWALVVKRDPSGDGYDFADSVLDGSERMVRWASMIKDLGHVIHLLQDAAQPQHVRNDAHGPPLSAAWPEAEADAAFEAFTNYRVLGNRSAALALTRGGNPLRRMHDDALPTENNLAAIHLGSSNYYPGAGGRVQFSTPVKFFTTGHVETGTDEASLKSRRGLADLSNRSFFTSGTLPGFRECQTPGVSGCTPTASPAYLLPPNDLTTSGYTEALTPSGLRVHGRVVHLAEYTLPITDQVAPTYDQSSGVLAAYGGKAPLVTKGIWHDIVPDDLLPQHLEATGYLLTYNNMRYMADVMVPRAVGYSVGLIDFFFRGRLEVTPIDQDIIAVMNQGDPHTVTSEGYPRQFANPTRAFGFEKVRLRVRNVSEDIVESGTGTVVPQSTGGAGSRLVAIAKYHRNACYSQDLSGERVRNYAGAITEPSCTNPVRSQLQEVSVSTPLTIAAGELDTATPVEKLFDFSADPIPINATDLFITVAYRGKLGDEADGIALGTYDVSEPTIASFWNNTDYYWNGTNYVQQVAAYPLRNVYSFYVCAGSPSKFLYRYVGASGAVALGIPPQPGQLRLALIVGRPDNATQRFPVRAVPIMQASPHASLRSSFTRGQYRQASKEIVAPSVLAAPYENCFVNPPPASVDTWCFDPIHKRRGLLAGDIAQPIYWNSSATTGEGPDVDSVPLPAFSSAALRDGGEIRFNETGALQNCPSQPAALPEDEWETELHEVGANTSPRTLLFRYSIV